jgi:hypothetical protein
MLSIVSPNAVVGARSMQVTIPRNNTNANINTNTTNNDDDHDDDE